MIKDTEILEWLDNIIEKQNELIDLGERYKKEDVRFVMGLEKREIHIRGIERIAHILGITIKYKPNWAEEIPEYGEISVIYKGIKLYELWMKKGESK